MVSTVQNNEDCGEDLRKAGTDGEMVMLYGLETVTLRKRHEAELEAAETK